MNRMVRDILEITMPNRAFILCISFMAGMLLAQNLDIVTMALGAVMLLFAYCAQAVFNNICDVEGDKVNAPQRPLARGSISIRAAWATMAVLIGIASLIGSLISPMMIYVNLFYVLIGFVYSKITKEKWIFSYSTLVTSHMVVPLVTGYLISQSFDIKIVVIALFMYITEVLAFSIKDYKDVEGDKAMGMKTLPIVFNMKDAVKITTLGLSLPLFLVWIPWQALGLSPLFLSLYLIAGWVRYSFARRLASDPSPSSAGHILKNFRYVLLLEMGAWCLS